VLPLLDTVPLFVVADALVALEVIAPPLVVAAPVVAPVVDAAHCPATQAWPAPQALSQTPQWAKLLAVSTQSWPHRVEPTTQPSAHAPCEQTCAAEHATPQEPQFAASPLTSTHAPAHMTCGAVQTAPPPVVPLVTPEPVAAP